MGRPVPRHWVERCEERGVGVDAEHLWGLLRDAHRRGDERFIRHLGNARGKRGAYAFKTPGGSFVAIICQTTHRPVTVLSEGMSFPRPKPSRRRRKRVVKRWDR